MIAMPVRAPTIVNGAWSLSSPAMILSISLDELGTVLPIRSAALSRSLELADVFDVGDSDMVVYHSRSFRMDCLSRRRQ